MAESSTDDNNKCNVNEPVCYSCPVTGAHFPFDVICEKLLTLKYQRDKEFSNNSKSDAFR